MRRGGVSFHPSCRTLQVSSAKLHSTPACIKSILAERSQYPQRVISGDSVPFVQSEIKPQGRRVRIIRENLFENSMHRSGIGSLLYVDPSTSQPVGNVVWFEGDETINGLSGLFVLAQQSIGHCGTSEDFYVSRVQRGCPLEVAHGIMPTALTAVDESSPFKNSCIVGQGAGGDGELVTGVVVIKVAMVKVPCEGEVHLARIWLQAKSGIDRGFRQLQATRGVIEPKKIELIVRFSQPAICEKKSGTARDRLIEQLYRLEIIFSLLFMFFIRGLVDQRRRL